MLALGAYDETAEVCGLREEHHHQMGSLLSIAPIPFRGSVAFNVAEPARAVWFRHAGEKLGRKIRQQWRAELQAR